MSWGALLPAGVTLFGLLALGPVLALLVRRRARKPGSTAWKIAQAGLKALPGVVAAGGGAILASIGLAYFGFLFMYWLFDTIIQTVVLAIIDSFTGHHDKLHYGAIYGQVALQGGLFLAGGVVLVMVGMGLFAVVGGFAVGRAVTPPQPEALPPPVIETAAAPAPAMVARKPRPRPRPKARTP